MNKTLKLSSLFVTSLLASTHALASQAPQWDFIQANYAKMEIDDLDTFDLAGFGLSGSKLINENFFVSLNYQQFSDSTVIYNSKIKLDTTSLSAGLGYRYGLSTNIDVFGKVSFENVDANTSFNGDKDSIDDTGYGLTLGVRSMVTDSFELNGSIAYVDIDDESETGFAVSAFYHFNANLSAGVGYNIADDVDTLNASIRYAF